MSQGSSWNLINLHSSEVVNAGELKFREGYARLYRAVILRAVQDLAQKEFQSEAREWLLSAESNRAFATARISATGIRQQII